jgi:hypothetical protein
MPSAFVKKLAKETGLTVKKIEQYWEDAKDIAGEKFDEDSDRYWAYVTGIVKRRTANSVKDKALARLELASLR